MEDKENAGENISSADADPEIDVAKSRKEIFVEAQGNKLEDKIEKLEHELIQLKEEHLKLSNELSREKGYVKGVTDGSFNQSFQKDYDKEMKRHIRQLKKYNELKDLGMGIIQLIADQKQSTLRGIMDEMGIEPDDK
ncbi:hypothetical protein PICMEDRAFT_10385 [Pichia membranifaciens NRRL Y-2026]|uniref:Uncharacterized protein n=1 Tax=Pichia membranifaciens NRRL Y-2026 TaxID=763406 RepID=A0A1E3NNY2_9ASCO|nr:hypothetical protein PICMEDRAFT_10385 [Pichia membranifaciens NRRL Y-2026]ODQ47388.1 hypothetical protein PICMEDRAFT_10385 [Pichia membranifaciens NRRL Y-2026]